MKNWPQVCSAVQMFNCSIEWPGGLLVTLLLSIVEVALNVLNVLIEA